MRVHGTYFSGWGGSLLTGGDARGFRCGTLALGRPYMSVLMFDSENLITMTP